MINVKLLKLVRKSAAAQAEKKCPFDVADSENETRGLTNHLCMSSLKHLIILYNSIERVGLKDWPLKVNLTCILMHITVEMNGMAADSIVFYYLSRV